MFYAIQCRILERANVMDGKSKLPWESLGLVEGDIPWKALHEFAAAVVTDTSVADELIDLYDSVWQADFEVEHYEDLYVPAIFALASPQLGDESRSHRSLATRVGEESGGSWLRSWPRPDMRTPRYR